MTTKFAIIDEYTHAHFSIDAVDIEDAAAQAGIILGIDRCQCPTLEVANHQHQPLHNAVCYMDKITNIGWSTELGKAQGWKQPNHQVIFIVIPQM